jgi:alkanesulfonate monooxygenase SsuD/methylene tetrahydromethanopterin reductase-like flavin-dependent oxidoreductase (luciferase family)
MGIGIMMPTSDQAAPGTAPRFADLLSIAQRAEALGFDSLWVPDHFVYRYPDDARVYGVWEAWTLLAALAARTTKISLCVFVTGLVFRNPGVVAKMAESLDEISQGRFILGLGAGSRQPDFDFLGMPFDHRASKSEEAIEIIASLLRTGRADVQGRFYQATDAHNLPRGPLAATGGVPILIGTRGPRMLRLTARFADAWNGDWHATHETVAPLLCELDRVCRENDRAPATMIRTAGSIIQFDTGSADPRVLGGDDAQIAAGIAGFRALGLDHYIARVESLELASLERLAMILEHVDRTTASPASAPS